MVALPLFSDVPDQEVTGALTDGSFARRSFFRDEVIADGQARSLPIFLVERGEVALSVLSADVLAEERAWLAETPLEERKRKIRAQGPMIRRARRHLATFSDGELVNAAALRKVQGSTCALFAVRPTEVIAIDPGRLGQLTARHPALAQRLRDRLEASARRVASLAGPRAEVHDYYVRHGLSVAGSLRVLQVDRCIECRQCEEACEERFGRKRLSIHGPRLGLVDFAVTCRTCVDQRCISPCNFDSITFDARLGEVIINEETCTGCSACATACPYGAIEMVALGDPANARFKARLEKKGALPGQQRAEVPELIASKCDHCAGFAEQACVSRCPTGALIELHPGDVFAAMRPAPFLDGLGISDAGRARVGSRPARPGLLWTVSLIAFLGALAEILLRLLAPAWSAQYFLARLDGLEPEVARFRVGYLAGCPLSLWLGYLGTGLIIVALLYPLRKRSPLLGRLSRGTTWFDLHLVGGTMGPALILLHSAFNLDNWVSFAFWAFVVVVASGLFGRFLFTRMSSRFPGDDIGATRRGPGRLEGMFRSWQFIHVALTLVACVLTAVHILWAMRFSM